MADMPTSPTGPMGPGAAYPPGPGMMMPPPAPSPAPEAAGSGGGDGVWIGVGLGLLVLVAVLAFVLGTGDDDDGGEFANTGNSGGVGLDPGGSDGGLDSDGGTGPAGGGSGATTTTSTTTTTAPPTPARAGVGDCVAVTSGGDYSSTGTCLGGGPVYRVVEVVDTNASCADSKNTWTHDGDFKLCLELNFHERYCYEIRQFGHPQTKDCNASGVDHVVQVVLGGTSGDDCTSQYEMTRFWTFDNPQMVVCTNER